MTVLRWLVGPLQLICVNFGVDTLLVNFKLSDDGVLPKGAPLPESVCFQLDEWQADTYGQQ